MKLHRTEIDPEQAAAQAVQEHLTELEHQIQERTVLGENTDAQRPQAFDLLHEYGLLSNWTTKIFDEKWGELSVSLNNPPPSIYHKWINTFANRSITARLSGDDYDDYDSRLNANKAHAVLQNLSRSRKWDAARHQTEISRLEAFLAAGEIETPPQLSRLQKAQAKLGVVVMSGFARLGSAAHSSEETAPEASEEEQTKNRRRTIYAVGAAAVVGAIGVVGLLYGLDVIGGASKAHHQMANMPHPTKMPHGSGTANSVPTPSRAPSSSQTQTAKPSIPTRSGPSRPKVPKTPTSTKLPGARPKVPTTQTGVRPHVEHLRYRFDNIWEHARRALGKKATAQQVADYDHKIIKVNHISEWQARHLAIGKSFLMPAHK